MLPGFNAVERFNSNTCAASQFGLRPPKTLTVPDYVTSQYCSHRGNRGSVSSRVRGWKTDDSLVLRLRQNYKSLAAQNHSLDVSDITHRKNRRDVQSVQ
jgi:hypothetical protein